MTHQAPVSGPKLTTSKMCLLVSCGLISRPHTKSPRLCPIKKIPLLAASIPLPKKIPPLLAMTHPTPVSGPKFTTFKCACYMWIFLKTPRLCPKKIPLLIPLLLPMTHRAPVSGPKLITTRQLAHFPYHHATTTNTNNTIKHHQ